MVAWSIQHNWNEVFQDKLNQVSGTILHKDIFLLNEFQITNFSVAPPVVLVCAQWEAPRSPWYKLNIDGRVTTALGRPVWGLLFETLREK